MARIVGAFGASHGPLLTTPPDQWQQRAAYDRRNPRHAHRGVRLDFAGLLAARGDVDFAPELEPARQAARHAACQAAIDEVAARFRACGADAAIILGNDQHELFKDDNTPAFLVYAGAEIANVEPGTDEMERLHAMGLGLAVRGHVPPGGAVYPGAPEIADALVDGLIDRDFDVALSRELPKPGGIEHGIPHAFGFIFNRIMRDAVIPTVPIFMNVGEGRNQPHLRRLLAFGHALGATIAALPADLKLAIFVSGGLSHYTVDEEFDQAVIAAMRSGDERALAAFPEPWFWGNTCESKSWLAMAAAMNDAGRTLDVIDYIPCYRSEAGTGQGMIFTSWN